MFSGRKEGGDRNNYLTLLEGIPSRFLINAASTLAEDRGLKQPAHDGFAGNHAAREL